MIFVSKGYFLSKNCLREARCAMEKSKPLSLMHDPVRGPNPRPNPRPRPRPGLNPTPSFNPTVTQPLIL